VCLWFTYAACQPRGLLAAAARRLLIAIALGTIPTVFWNLKETVMLKSSVANRCGHRPAVAGLLLALFFSLLSTSSAQLLRRPRRATREDNTAQASEGSAPQATGVPGSPSATTTISGKQLPAPDPKFDGM